MKTKLITALAILMLWGCGRKPINAIKYQSSNSFLIRECLVAHYDKDGNLMEACLSSDTGWVPSKKIYKTKKQLQKERITINETNQNKRN